MSDSGMNTCFHWIGRCFNRWCTKSHLLAMFSCCWSAVFCYSPAEASKAMGWRACRTFQRPAERKEVLVRTMALQVTPMAACPRLQLGTCCIFNIFFLVECLQFWFDVCEPRIVLSRCFASLSSSGIWQVLCSSTETIKVRSPHSSPSCSNSKMSEFTTPSS